MKTKLLTLTLLTALALAALSPTLLIVNAQGQGTIVILDSIGGTTDPAPGTKTYPDGTDVTLTATPIDSSYVFAYWIVESPDSPSATITDNPTTIPALAGVTFTVQAVFTPIQSPTGVQLPSDLSSAAIVVVLPSAGGSTTPAAGTYALGNAENLMLTATAQSGWQFSHWTICGTSTNHGGAPTNWAPTDNPYNVNHGYGYTYYYQAVFTQTGSTEPTPVGATPTPTAGGTVGGLSMEMLIIIALVVVIVIILIAFGVFAMRRNKHP